MTCHVIGVCRSNHQGSHPTYDLSSECAFPTPLWCLNYGCFGQYTVILQQIPTFAVVNGLVSLAYRIVSVVA